jgi:galactosamine-6-phosphate isomerase
MPTAETQSREGESRPRATASTPPAGWRWHVAADYEALSQAAAARVLAELRRKPEAIVCLATGASPRRTYELLALRGQTEPSQFAQVRWLKLDEWGGLAMDDPATCETYLRRILIEPLRVPLSRFISWQSQPADPQAECRRMEAWLAAHGPVDLQVLGLGEDGHLGLNEPADRLAEGPHVAELSETLRAHPMLGESRRRVRHGLTLGMEDILKSRQVLLLVSGAHKAKALRRLAVEPVSTQFPASLLRRHSAVSIFCDGAAAMLLPRDGRMLALPP